MSELTESHPDNFTLLRYAAGDLGDFERVEARRHLERCADCSKALRELEAVNEQLKQLAARGDLRIEADAVALPQDDPFRRRPDTPLRTAGTRRRDLNFLARAASASEQGAALQARLLEAASTRKSWASVLEGLSLSQAADRYGLLYALQEAGRRIAESTARARIMAEGLIEHLRREEHGSFDTSEAEASVPVLAILGQAHLLAGQAANWTARYDLAGIHFRLAYRAFGSVGDEFSLAHVELAESQRRSFEHRGLEALALVRRAAVTFEELGLEDFVARAAVAEGMAWHSAGRKEEAVLASRRALPVFERLGLWSNYVGAVNTIATCLVSLERLDEARQGYARALRRVSGDAERSWVPFLRFGLAQTLFVGKRFRESAASFGRSSRLFADFGMLARALTAALMEIESWARDGDLARARQRLEIFRAEAERHRALEPSALRLFEEALGGQQPDFDRFTQLRESAETTLQERLPATA
jgi:tetratricopeptide (TPR) repeat protein